MILDFIRNFSSQNVSILEVQNSKNSQLFRLFNFVFHKKKIKLSGKINESDCLTDLIELIPEKQAVCILIVGTNVIFKTVKHEDDTTKVDLTSLFPGIEPEAICYHLLPQENHFDFLAVVRKEIIDVLISTFKIKNCFIVKLFLGPAVALYLVKNEKIAITEIDIGYYQLILDKYSIVGFKSFDKSKDYQLEEIENVLCPRNYLAYSSALAYFQKSSCYEVKNDYINYSQSEFKAYIKINLIGIFSLVVIFLILLINLFITTHYSNLLIDIKGKDSFRQTLNISTPELNEKIKTTEYLVSISNFKNNARYSYFADRIAIGIPDELKLTKLIFNPISNVQVAELNSLTYRDSVVIVEGLTKSSSCLTDFTKYLRKLSWIKEIQFLDYRQNNGIQEASFKIELKISKK